MVVTSKQIMDEAMKLFQEYGYQQVSVEMICSRFQVTRGSFYHHFKNKDDLLIQWFKELVREMNSQIVIDESQNAYQQLQYILMKWAAALENIGHELLNESMTAVFRELKTSQKADDFLMLFGADLGMDAVLTVRLTEKAQKQNLIDNQYTAAELIQMYSYAIIGLCINWHMMNGQFSLTDEVLKIFKRIF